jgi:hypothetical protein
MPSPLPSTKNYNYTLHGHNLMLGYWVWGVGCGVLGIGCEETFVFSKSTIYARAEYSSLPLETKNCSRRVCDSVTHPIASNGAHASDANTPYNESVWLSILSMT